MYLQGTAFSLEKNKRKLKTPFQVDALEKFYNEHKYPSETRKSQFAEDVGLSLKQVSGWFCHRRLKDKRLAKDDICANGTQNICSDVVHDHSSGLRQESCSSTKHGDRRPFDFREVESKRFHGQISSSTVLASRKRGQRKIIRHYTPVDTRSCGSSSASQERLLHQCDKPDSMETLRYSILNGDHILTNIKHVKKRGCMLESGFSYSQEENENPAISAAKRRLGRHYCEDGPPLGVEFQPLPPGAFHHPIEDTSHESYYGANFVKKHSNSMGGADKESKVCDKFRYRWRHPRTLYPKGISAKKTTKVLSRTYMLEMDDGSAGEASNFSNRNHGTCSKYSVKGRSIHSRDNNIHLCAIKAVANKPPSYPHT